MSIANTADFLEAWLQHEKKSITYRLMSRERGCHVEDAKRHMKEYYDKQGGDVHATFIIKGVRKGREEIQAKKRKADEDSEEPSAEADSSFQATPASKQESILLVSDAKLEAAKERFESISFSHIYSLQAGVINPTSTSSLLLATQTELHGNSKYAQAWEAADRGVQLGVMRNKQVEDLLDPKVKQKLLNGTAGGKRALPGSASDVAAAASNKSRPANLPSAPAAAAASASAKGKTSSDAAPAAVKKEVKKGTLDFSKAKPKKTVSPPAAAAEPKKKKGNARLVSDDEEEEEEEEEEEDTIGYADDALDAHKKAPLKSKEQREKDRKALMALADSDAEDEEEEDSAGKGKGKATGKSTKAKADDSDTEMQDPAPAAGGERKKVRKQRKVIKKEKTKNAKGYTVMRDVEAYESYSSYESDEGETKTKKSSAAKKTAAPAPATSKPAAAPASKSASAAGPSKPAPAQQKSSAPPAKTKSSSGGGSGSGSSSKNAPGLAKGQSSLMSFFGKKKP